VATQILLISTPQLAPLDWRRRRPCGAESRRRISDAPLPGVLCGVLLIRQTHAEAEFFARLVLGGRMAREQAEDTIAVPAECRTALEALAAAHPDAEAKMVKDALRLRGLALAEFRRLLASS